MEHNIGRIRRLSVGNGFPNECIHYQVKTEPKIGEIAMIVRKERENGVEDFYIYRKTLNDAIYESLSIQIPSDTLRAIQFFEEDIIE